MCSGSQSHARLLLAKRSRCRGRMKEPRPSRWAAGSSRKTRFRRGRLLSIRRKRRHLRCLANIDRLERELFPWLFPAPEKTEWLEDASFSPGARWAVENHDAVRTHLAARGLLQSGDFGSLAL